MTKSKLAVACAIATVALSAGAQAAVTTLSLTGVISNGTYNTFTSNGMIYHTYVLDLRLGTSAPFTVSAGDEIQTTVTLDTALPVYAAGQQFLGLNYNGSSSPDGASNSGSFLFSGVTGTVANPVSTGCGNCLSSIFGQVPGATYAFTGLFADTSILTLNTPFLVNDVSISYQLSSPVPELAAWTLMLIGFGAVGAAVRRRRMTSALA